MKYSDIKKKVVSSGSLNILLGFVSGVITGVFCNKMYNKQIKVK